MHRGALVEIVKATAREVAEDDISGLASQIAYRLIFALPPLLIFFGALSSVVARYTGVDVFQNLLDLGGHALPTAIYQTVEMLLSEVRSEGGGGLASTGLIIALGSASSGVEVMMRAFNRAYGVTERRSFARRWLMAIGLTIGLSLMVIVAFVLFVFGGHLGDWLAGQAGLGAAFAQAWDIARWPAATLLFMLALAILYTVGPTIDTPFHLVTGGTVLATLLWVAASLGFSYFLRVVNPGSAYGALGAAVVLLFFLYVTSLILLLGAELNAVLDQRFDPEIAHERDAPAAASASLEATPPHPTEEPARRAAVAALIVSLVSLVVAAVIEALRRTRPGRA